MTLDMSDVILSVCGYKRKVFKLLILPKNISDTTNNCLTWRNCLSAAGYFLWSLQVCHPLLWLFSLVHLFQHIIHGIFYARQLVVLSAYKLS